MLYKSSLLLYSLTFLISLGITSTQAQEKEVKVNEETGLIEAVYFHDNGVVSQKGTFNISRQLHGEWISFNETGEKIAQGNYLNGMKTGTWYFWFEDSVRVVEYDQNIIAEVNVKKAKKKKVDKY